jgi:tetratricopeptide (TPR) repeat protein
LREKAPFFGLVAGLSVATFIAQKQAGAMTQIENLTLPDRLANAVVSYVRYLGKILWPHPLAILYPYQRDLSEFSVIVCLLTLIAITVLVFLFGGNRRYLPVGWLWFLGTMIPMIGIVQVGWQSYADRYTYIPSIGIIIAIVWLVADLTKGKSRPGALAAAAVLAALALTTWLQLSYWRDDVTLFQHAIASTSANPGAQFHLSGDLVEQGRYIDAVPHLEETIRLQPSYYPAYYMLGEVYVKLGDLESAARNFSQTIRLKPDYAEAYYARGTVRITAGNEQAAEPDFRETLKYRMNAANAEFTPLAHDALGVIEAKRGDMQRAVGDFEAAIQVRPDLVSPQRNLASALVAQGRVDDAISHLERAVAATHGDPTIRSMLDGLRTRK